LLALPTLAGSLLALPARAILPQAAPRNLILRL
jgi:hypothetical protein